MRNKGICIVRVFFVLVFVRILIVVFVVSISKIICIKLSGKLYNFFYMFLVDRVLNELNKKVIGFCLKWDLYLL